MYMYMYMYMCIYIYIYTYMYICIYININAGDGRPLPGRGRRGEVHRRPPEANKGALTLRIIDCSVRHIASTYKGVHCTYSVVRVRVRVPLFRYPGHHCGEVFEPRIITKEHAGIINYT